MVTDGEKGCKLIGWPFSVFWKNFRTLSADLISLEREIISKIWIYERVEQVQRKPFSLWVH